MRRLLQIAGVLAAPAAPEPPTTIRIKDARIHVVGEEAQLEAAAAEEAAEDGAEDSDEDEGAEEES
ncbi:MAG: hypothetical protein MUE66_09735 [Acidimicrobiia bacterium]|nr:hypothetical protein [Acidimicrobiia bacterium]